MARYEELPYRTCVGVMLINTFSVLSPLPTGGVRVRVPEVDAVKAAGFSSVTWND